MISPSEPAASPDGPTSSAPASPLGPVRLGLLLLWAATSFGTCWFARDLQSLPGLPLQAYGWAAQGILIVFIVLVVVNAWYFNRRSRQADDGV